MALLTTRRARALAAAFVVALVALVFVDCFDTTRHTGWSEPGEARHVTTVARLTTARDAASPRLQPGVAIVPSSNVLVIVLVLCGVVAVGTDRRRALGARTPASGRSPPPFSLRVWNLVAKAEGESNGQASDAAGVAGSAR